MWQTPRVSYERNPVLHAHIDDVDRDALLAFVEERVRCLETDREAWAVRLGLLGKAGARVLPSPVGLLCFGLYPQRVMPAWGISAVRVRGHNIADEIAASEHLEGDVGQLITGACDFVAKHALSAHDDEDEDAAEYAAVAVREAVTNAVIHRDLRKPGRVGVHLYDDRLEVWSPGGVPEALGDLEEALTRGGVSMPRNPLLCATARERGWMRQIGRGLATIQRAARAARIEVRVTSRGFCVTFPSRFPVATRGRQ